MFVLAVPVWPYKPHCGIYYSANFRTLDGKMTPDYLTAIDRALSKAGVYHWHIGDHIYLRLFVPLLPEGDFSLLGPQSLALARLVSPTISDSYVGQELLGRIYWPPAHLQSLVDERGSPIDYDDCVFVRAVAFGEPPPPGYTPDPWPRGAEPTLR